MPTSNQFTIRELWLKTVMQRVTEQLFEPMYEVPQNIRVSCGFPSRGSLIGTKNQRIGECWGDTSSADGHFEIFISPTLDDSLRVADVLVHEICHTVAGVKAKHGAAFKRVATHVGLEGKMTSTTASEALQAKLAAIIDDIGPYPMGKLDARKMESTRKKQGTRLLKCECPQCGYTVRVTRKWIDEVGLPHCPHHGAMDSVNPTEESE